MKKSSGTKTTFLFAVLALTAAAVPTFAIGIPYPNPGTEILVAPTFTATVTGSITGYFYGFSAADSDSVQMLDLTSGTRSGWMFLNQITVPGTSANFGAFTAGDRLVFELNNYSIGQTFASDPAYSADGAVHAYTTSYDGTGGPAGIPAGIFVGMEDLPNGGTDWDYNDDQFVFTNVAGSTPEPGTFLMFGSGVIGLAGIMRRNLMR